MLRPRLHAARSLLVLGALALAPPAARAHATTHAPQGAPERVARDEPLTDEGTLASLRGLGTDLSRLGVREAVELLGTALVDLGEDPDVLSKLAERWNIELEKDGGNALLRGRAATRVRRAADKLADGLEGAEGERRTRLARIVARLDRDNEAAQRALGRELEGGVWYEPAERALIEGAARVETLLRDVDRLEIALTRETDDSEAAITLFGEPLPRVTSASGLSVSGPFGYPRLERMLERALRAAALSNALLGNELAVPRSIRRSHVLLLDSRERFLEAQVEALLAGGLQKESVVENMESFLDTRGWRTSSYRSEAANEALLLWSCAADWMGRDAQPCLVAGHVNWICLAYFGAPIPITLLPTDEAEEARTLSELMTRDDDFAFQRASRKTRFGCRAWMLRLAEAGLDPPFARSLVDHMAKVVDRDLLKSTLVVEYLQAQGTLGDVVRITGRNGERRALFEAAFGMGLEEFETRWRRWLVGEAVATLEPGVAQLLVAVDAPVEQRLVHPVHAEIVRALNEFRSRAVRGSGGEYVEFEEVRAYEELELGAAAHVDYLLANEAVWSVWPDVHEEDPDHDAFTPEGARAGANSVIAFHVDGAEAIDAWMGTFYHRLPLLNPGLFGVGAADGKNVVVLDVGSLVVDPWVEHWVVWPPDGGREIPCRFVATEIPHPVPGEDQRKWGYPITLQVYQPHREGAPRVELSLWKSKNADGSGERKEVDCHVITPDAPLNPELAPANTWCLIPKRALDAEATYVIVGSVAGEDVPREWSFRTGR